MSSTTKSRKDMRAVVALVARYRSPATFEFVQEACCDVSAGGMFIKSENPAAAGTLLKLECEAEGGDGRIRGVARVVWLRREPNEHGPSGMGVKFVKLEPGSKEIITRTVERLAESGVEPRSMSEAPEAREAAGVAARGRSLRPAAASVSASTAPAAPVSSAPAVPVSSAPSPGGTATTMRPGSARPSAKPLGSVPAPAASSLPPARAAIGSAPPAGAPLAAAHGSNGAPAESSSAGGLGAVARASGRAQTLMGMPPVRMGDVPEVPEGAAVAETLAEVRALEGRATRGDNGAGSSENVAREALERASLPVAEAVDPKPQAASPKVGQNGGVPSVIVAEDYPESPGKSAREVTLRDSPRPGSKATTNAIKVWLGVAAAVAILLAIILADEGSDNAASSAAPSGEKTAPSSAPAKPAPNPASSAENKAAPADSSGSIAVGVAPNVSSAEPAAATGDQPASESGATKPAAESGAMQPGPAANGLAAPGAKPEHAAAAKDNAEPAKSSRVDPGLSAAKPPAENAPAKPNTLAADEAAPRPKPAAAVKDGMPWVIDFVTRPAGATIVVGEQSIVAPGSLRFDAMPEHVKVTAKKAGFETSSAWLDRTGFTDVDGTHWRRVYMTLPNPDPGTGPAAPPPAETPAP